jgi:hypothetical protein
MSPRGLTVSCKSPPFIRVRVDSRSPFGHALTQVPVFGHALTQGVNRRILFLVKLISRHCVIKWRHSFKILTDHKCAHHELSFEVLHNKVPTFQNLTFGYTIFHPGANHEGHWWLTLKIIQLRGRPCATFTPSMKLIHSKILKKIRFLSVLCLGPILTLTFDFDPYHLVWLLLTPKHLYMLTIMILRCNTKKFIFRGKFSFYVMTSPNDVIASKFELI